MSDFLMNLVRRSRGISSEVALKPAFVPYFPPLQRAVRDMRPELRLSHFKDLPTDESIAETEAEIRIDPEKRTLSEDRPERRALSPQQSGSKVSIRAHDLFAEMPEAERTDDDDATLAEPKTVPVISEAASKRLKPMDLRSTPDLFLAEKKVDGVEELPKVKSISEIGRHSEVPLKVVKGDAKEPERISQKRLQESVPEESSMVDLERGVHIAVIPAESHYPSHDLPSSEKPRSKVNQKNGDETPFSHPATDKAHFEMPSLLKREEWVDISVIQPRPLTLYETKEAEQPLIRPARIQSPPIPMPAATKPVPSPVRVHIGTVEIRAFAPAQPPLPVQSPSKTPPKPEGFKDYLLLRNYMSREQLGY